MYKLFCFAGLGLLIAITSGKFINTEPEPIKKEKLIFFYKEEDVKWHKVKATVFNPEPGQTDSNPFVTASGRIIDKDDPASSRLVGLSRDLLKRFSRTAPFDYGDTIVVLQGHYTGLWVVADCGNIRLKHTVDFCVGKNDSLNSWKSILISKY